LLKQLLPFTVNNAVFLTFLCFYFKNQRLKRCTIDFDQKNALLLCNGTVLAHNTLTCLKMEKNAFLVRYGSRQIAFLTLIPWVDIFCYFYTVNLSLSTSSRPRYQRLKNIVKFKFFLSLKHKAFQKSFSNS
jgi:hypothetical protein